MVRFNWCDFSTGGKKYGRSRGFASSFLRQMVPIEYLDCPYPAKHYSFKFSRVSRRFLYFFGSGVAKAELKLYDQKNLLVNGSMTTDYFDDWIWKNSCQKKCVMWTFQHFSLNKKNNGNKKVIIYFYIQLFKIIIHTTSIYAYACQCELKDHVSCPIFILLKLIELLKCRT